MIFNRDDITSPSTSTKKRSVIHDDEFGAISYRRSDLARYVRLRVSEDGTVRASLPKRAPLYMIKELLESSREEIRKLIAASQAKRVQYEDGMTIGHSHRLTIRYEPVALPKKAVHGQAITVVLPQSFIHTPVEAQLFISEQVKRALRREATAYLPRRLRHLADTFGFDYERERFGNQRGRWGSCSSSGTISLNVALMNLPHDVIDYVLIHELAHTRQMNHSEDFWRIVENCMPDYRDRRKLLKSMSPIC